jgi:hypothetical protein
MQGRMTQQSTLQGTERNTGTNPYPVERLEYSPGYLRLGGRGSVKDPFIELGVYNSYDGSRMQIASCVWNGSGPFNGYSSLGWLGSLDFIYVYGSGVGTQSPIFNMSTVGGNVNQHHTLIL